MRLRKIILSLGLSALMLTSAPLSAMEPVSVQAAACKHYHRTNYVVKAATCTDQGIKKRKCDDCGATIKTYTVPALGHKLYVKTTPATCLATGLSVSTCKRCGKEIKREVLPKGDHNYTTKITKIATTTSEGESKTYCINCGYVKEVNVIPKKGSSTTINCTHPQKTTVVTKKPTCQSTGVQAVRCTTCNKVLSTTTLPKTGHSYVTKVVKKAGIYNEGLERIYCEYCGTVKEERVIPKLTREVYISDTALSLTAGRHKTIRILYATHDVTWKSSNKSVATVDKNGRITAIKVGTSTISTVYDGKTYSCKLTVTAKPVSISATSLSLQKGKQTKLKLNNATSTVTWKSSNTKVVTVDQYGNVVGVKAGTATVTATCGGQTYTCRMTITKASSTPTVCKHTNTTVETTNPTCIKAGSKVTRCKDCKKVLKTERIAATGHKPDSGTTTAATCQKTGKIVYKCTVCGVTTSTKTLPKTSHNYVYKVITPATTTSTGKAKTYCTYCNKIKETTVIPKLTNTTKTMSIPLYLMANYSKVKYGDGTLATCGQGPICLAMVASYKSGKTVTPADIVNQIGNKYYTKRRGTSANIFFAANNYGIKSVTRTKKQSEVISALKAGKPVVSVQKKGLFTKKNTFIVLRGIDKNGKILVNSPEDTKKSIYKSSYNLSTQIAKTSSTFLIIN